MRSAYWTMLQTHVYNEMYYQRYRTLIAKIDTGVKVLSAIVSCSSIALWGIWGKYPAVWLTLISFSQVVQVVYPLLPFSKQLSALEFMLPDLQKLVQRILDTWRTLENNSVSSDSDYQNALSRFEKEFSDLETKYLGTSAIPAIELIRKKAWKDCTCYLIRFFFSKKTTPTGKKDTTKRKRSQK